MKNSFTLLLLLGVSPIFAQSDSALFSTLRSKDSLLFGVGFNRCDVSQFEKLLSDNFEFYHDEAGIISNKVDFITSIRDGLCKLPYKPRRELVENSLEVYPLRKDGAIYGAIQMGVHRFFASENGKPEHMTSIAKFTHLWILENGEWKLRRVLSYEHEVKVK